MKDRHDILENSDLKLKKAFIRGFIKEIIVRGDEVTMTYIMPGIEDGNGKWEGVPSTVQYGGR